MSQRTRFAKAYHAHCLSDSSVVFIYVVSIYDCGAQSPPQSCTQRMGIARRLCQLRSVPSSQRLRLSPRPALPPHQRHIHALISQYPHTVFAMINMEAHSYSFLPAAANNTVVISYQAASDLIVSYCCSFDLLLRLCTVVPGAPGRPRCGPGRGRR